MAQILYRNITVLLVFATMAAFSWVWGGAKAGPLLSVIPWLWALMFEGLLCFPQRRGYEDIGMARSRVWRSIAHDPLFYFIFAFLFVLLFPLFNVGLCQSCHYDLIMKGADPKPPVPFAPFCVSVEEHYGVLQWFVPVFTAILAARHSLCKDGKRALYELFVWNGALLAAFGFIQQATGAEAPYWNEMPKGKSVYFFSTFGYPNMGASYFTMCFAMAVGLWRRRAREVADMPRIHSSDGGGPKKERQIRRIAYANYSLIPAALCFFGALGTLSRAAIIMVTSLAVLAFVLTLVEKVNSRKNRVENIKSAAAMIVFGVLFLTAANVFMPDELRKEADNVSSADVVNRISGKHEDYVRVATEVFRAHPMFGVGGWGFRHFCLEYMTENDLKTLATDWGKVGHANVHNDYMQFLCEHGAVGAGALAGILLCLLVPVFGKWRKVCRQGNFTVGKEAPPRPVALFAPPPPMLWTTLGGFCVMVHAFGDCPLRSPAVLMLLLVSFACIDGFVPREENRG